MSRCCRLSVASSGSPPSVAPSLRRFVAAAAMPASPSIPLSLNCQTPAEQNRSASSRPLTHSSASSASSAVRLSDARSPVPGPSLLDDYLCAELGPTALAARHNLTLEQLLDHFEDSAVPTSDIPHPTSSPANLLNRLEKFSIRRAAVIGALMRPEVLRNLYECMHAAPVGSETHRRACTTLLRVIDGSRPSPPTPAGEMSRPRATERVRPVAGGPRPHRSPPHHRMSEFLDESPPSAAPRDFEISNLKSEFSSSRCPTCGGPIPPRGPRRTPARRDHHATCTPSGCNGIHSVHASPSGGDARPDESGLAQPPAIHSQPDGLPDSSESLQSEVSNLKSEILSPDDSSTPLRSVPSEFSPASSDSDQSESSPCLCVSVVNPPPDSRAPT